MKILMIDSLVGNDYSFWLCRGLDKANQTVELITVKNREEETDEPFLVLPVSPAKGDDRNKLLKLIEYFYYLAWLLVYVIRTKANVVHFQFFRRQRIECLYFPILRIFSKSLVFTAHNILPHEHTRIDYYLKGIVYKTSSKIIVHTPGIKKRMLEMYNINPDKIHIVPAVLPVSEKTDKSITKSLSRKKLNLSTDDQILLFFGYIRDYKGLDILLEAFDLAKPQHEKLKLVVAGKPQTPELYTQYYEQIGQMKHRDDVIFIPEFIPEEEVDYYFRAADAVAVPYKEIYLSGVLQVAFSYGKPVLATNVGNFRTVIQPGENGFLTTENTSEEFAKIIDKAFKDIDKLITMGSSAYEIHENHPDWKEIGRLTIDVYED